MRVYGYLNGVEVAATNWFNNIDQSPDWFEIALNDVNRIVIESVPVDSGGGWYGMDNFTFNVVPEPISSVLFVAGGALLAGRRFLKSAKRRKRKGSEV